MWIHCNKPPSTCSSGCKSSRKHHCHIHRVDIVTKPRRPSAAFDIAAYTCIVLYGLFFSDGCLADQCRQIFRVIGARRDHCTRDWLRARVASSTGDRNETRACHGGHRQCRRRCDHHGCAILVRIARNTGAVVAANGHDSLGVTPNARRWRCFHWPRRSRRSTVSVILRVKYRA
jgi:hypothetical protein